MCVFVLKCSKFATFPQAVLPLYVVTLFCIQTKTREYLLSWPSSSHFVPMQNVFTLPSVAATTAEFSGDLIVGAAAEIMHCNHKQEKANLLT